MWASIRIKDVLQRYVYIQGISNYCYERENDTLTVGNNCACSGRVTKYVRIKK